MSLRRLVLTLVLAGGLTAPAAAAPIPLGGSTSVDLDVATLGVLTGLGLTVSPIPPATVVGTIATFPITGAEETGGTITRIFHSGGLSLTDGATVVGLSNFIVDLTQFTLFGFVNGGDDEVPLSDIAPTLALTLTDTAAGALNGAFGSQLQGGTPIGVASVNAQAVPEPTLLALAGAARHCAAVAAPRLRLADGWCARSRRPSASVRRARR